MRHIKSLLLHFGLAGDWRIQGGGGAHPARVALTAADLWFFYAQNANFSFFLLASLAIHVKTAFQ